MTKLDQAVSILKRYPMMRNTEVAKHVGCSVRLVCDARKVAGAPPRRSANNTRIGHANLAITVSPETLTRIDAAAAAAGKNRNGFLIDLLEERFGE